MPRRARRSVSLVLYASAQSFRSHTVKFFHVLITCSTREELSSSIVQLFAGSKSVKLGRAGSLCFELGAVARRPNSSSVPEHFIGSRTVHRF